MVRIPYPERVTPYRNGYVWTCPTDRAYERQGYKTAIKACGIIALCLFVLGGAFSMMVRDWQFFGITAGCLAVFLVIALVVYRIFDSHDGEVNERYRMSDHDIKIGERSAAVFFSYKSIKQVRMAERYIELKGTVRTARVYVPEEDRKFVEDWILGRIPADTAVLGKGQLFQS